MSSIPDGQELMAFFATLSEGAWVNAVGVAEGVEISVLRSGAESTDKIPGRVTLLSLSGPSSGPLFATLLLSGAAGPQISGGRLLRARSAGVWFTAIGPAPAGGRVSDTGAETASAGPPRAPRSAAAPGPAGWADLARLSASASEDETDEIPKYGDRVDHFVFGLCDVMVVRGDRLKIRDVKGPGRLREIALGAVRVLPPEDRDGKRVFKLLKRS